MLLKGLLHVWLGPLPKLLLRHAFNVIQRVWGTKSRVYLSGHSTRINKHLDGEVDREGVLLPDLEARDRWPHVLIHKDVVPPRALALGASWAQRA